MDETSQLKKKKKGKRPRWPKGSGWVKAQDLLDVSALQGW